MNTVIGIIIIALMLFQIGLISTFYMRMDAWFAAFLDIANGKEPTDPREGDTR